MKKFFVLGTTFALGLAMTSCKSSESAYKKAYEKAQAAQNAEESFAQQYSTGAMQQTTPVQVTAVTPTYTTTTPVYNGTATTTTTSSTPVIVTSTTDYSNVAVRSEAVTLVNGTGLKAFSVVVGSFGMMSNAQSLQNTLASRGYSAQIVQANVNGSPFYRVVATTFDTKDQAAQSRATLMGEYPGAWLLYKK